MLRAQPLLGRTLTAEDSRPNAAPVMLLGYDLWQSRFGSDPNIVGRGVRVGTRERQVVGVMPAGFHFPPDSSTDVIVPAPIPPQAPAERKSGWIFGVARLTPGRSLDDAGANLLALSQQMAREFPQSNQGSEYLRCALRDALVGETGRAFVLLFAAVGVVLLIACANVANLMLARAPGAAPRDGGAHGARCEPWPVDSRNCSPRASSSPSPPVRSASSLAHWGARLLVALVPRSAAVPGLGDVRINAGVLAFTLAVSAGTAIVFGLVSALTVRSENGAGALVTTRVTMGAGARRAASALVVAEVALGDRAARRRGADSAQLHAPAGRRSRIPHRSRADDRDSRAGGSLSGSARGAHVLRPRVCGGCGALPGVEEVGAGVVIPLTGNNWTVGVRARGSPAAARPASAGRRLSGGVRRLLPGAADPARSPGVCSTRAISRTAVRS